MTLPAEPLSAVEMRALLKAIPSRGKMGPRNRALAVLLWRTGLRIAEALALYPKDIDLDVGTVTVLRGKGSKRRTVGIDPEALAVIQLWLEKRRELGLTGKHPLICTLSVGRSFGKPMNPAQFRGTLKTYAAKAGIEKRVHPHGLRHTHAFELAMEGTPLLLIKAQLGHSSLATTERYVNHLAPAQLVQAMQQRTWAAADDAEAA